MSSASSSAAMPPVIDLADDGADVHGLPDGWQALSLHFFAY